MVWFVLLYEKKTALAQSLLLFCFVGFLFFPVTLNLPFPFPNFSRSKGWYCIHCNYGFDINHKSQTSSKSQQSSLESPLFSGAARLRHELSFSMAHYHCDISSKSNTANKTKDNGHKGRLRGLSFCPFLKTYTHTQKPTKKRSSENKFEQLLLNSASKQDHFIALFSMQLQAKSKGIK